MHIPDGFLSTAVCAATGAASAAGVAWTARCAQAETEESRAPLLGVMGAFVFAAQMINFPVGPGTTGHLMGGTLLALTLGPAAATVVMTAILAIQALIFQDGGVLALTANIFNMALAGVWAGYLPYRFWGRGRLRQAAVFTGGALSVMVCALLAVAELRLSGVPMPRVVLGVSLGLFAVNAVLEGVLTAGFLRALEALNPAWLRRPLSPLPRPVLVVVSVAAMLLVTGGVWIASADPDGLERLAANLGIEGRERVLAAAPLSGYKLRITDNPWLNKTTAGVAGVVLVFGAIVTFALYSSRRKTP